MENIIAIIGTGFSVIVVFGAAWIKVNVSIAEIRTKIIQLEKEIEHEGLSNSKDFIRMDDNFKEVFKGLTDIKVALQNKEDRK